MKDFLLRWWSPLLIVSMLVLGSSTGAGAVASDSQAVQAWAAQLQDVDDLVAAGQSEQAIQQLQRLLAKAPAYRASEAQLRLASIYGQQHRWDLAVSHGHDAIRAWPENGWIYLPVARILVAAQRPDEAIALCKEAAVRDTAVRQAAEDLIVQIRSGALTNEASSASPGSRPLAPMGPWSVPALIALLALLAGGAWWVWRPRRQAPSVQELVVPLPSEPRHGAHTGPMYAPIGLRPFEPGEVIGHYLILRMVGSSLHSILYCAEDQKLGRQVAVKQVGVGQGASSGVMARFQKEVQSLIFLSNHHDGVIKVYDFIEPGTLVTEWIEGQNLEECEQLPLDEILAIGISLCDVLAFAHAQGIVHRDIKPSNVMRTGTKLVKLLDFGIAKNNSLGTSNLTLDANVPIGTFTYMPPEQFAAPNQAKPQADIYALGLTLYRLITGGMPTEPWLGPRTFGLIPPDQFRTISLESPGIVLFMLAHPYAGEPTWLPDLNRCLRMAFEENPSDRYPEALAFKRELEGILHEVATYARR